MKQLLMVLVCGIGLTGCATVQPTAQAPDPQKVALDKARHDLTDSMQKLLVPSPAPLPIKGSAVAMESSAH